MTNTVGIDKNHRSADINIKDSSNIVVDPATSTNQTNGTQKTKIVDSNGTTTVGSNGAIATLSYGEAIAKNIISGIEEVHILGRNNVVNNTRADLWTGSTSIYVFPSSSGIQMKVFSTSGSDTLTGTGIQKIHVHYLDKNYLEQSEIISLSGTTSVNTVGTTIIRINGMHATQVGTSGQAVGAISLTGLDGIIEYANIQANYNEARMAVYTVPAGKTLYLNHWQGSSGTSTGSHFTRIALRTTSHHGILWPGAFNAIDEIGTLNGGNEITFPTPVNIPATADIKVTAISDASNANAVVLGAFHGWIE